MCSSDLISVRASFPNPQGKLRDGQLVRVKITIGEPQPRIVIPQAALLADQEGVYVFIVEDGKAQVRRIKTGGEAGEGIVVTTGLSGGEQVVVQGLQAVRPGAPVVAAPVPAAMKRG